MAARASIVIATIVAGAALARPARSEDRLAVVVAVRGDVVLSDLLTEVALAALAGRVDRDLIGLPELRPRLAEIAPEGDISRCLSTPVCLAGLGRVGGSSTAVVGSVERGGARFVLDLALVDLDASRRIVALPPTTVDGVDGLIAAVGAGATRLLVPPAPRPPPPVLLGPVAPSAPPPARDTRVRSRVTWAAYGASVLALAALSGAIVTGVIGHGYPQGADRAAAQQDLARRQSYATASTWLWVTTGVFSATAAAAFAWRFRLP